MAGIDILHQYTASLSTEPNTPVFTWVFWGLFIVFSLIGSYLLQKHNAMELLGFTIILSLVLALLLGVIAGLITGKDLGEEMRYKILVSENASLEEFNSKYEIIGEEGKIYIVREKPNGK